MTVTAIKVEDVKALGFTFEPIAVRIVGFDCYGRGFSDIRFNVSSVLAEHRRLTRLGYNVGLVDHGEGWRDCSTVAQVAAKLTAKRQAA